jgi:hypothetical protein
MRGPILALDIATRCGFALGSPGAIPRSGTVVLKRPDEPREVAFANFMFWLSARLNIEKPALIVKEAPFHLGAFAKVGNSEAAVKLTYGLHAIAEGLARRYGIRIESVADQTVRCHFIGKGRLGDRKATKAAVVERCQVLKLMPRECTDDNRADAIATWDWAAATFGRARPRELHLFNEAAP